MKNFLTNRLGFLFLLTILISTSRGIDFGLHIGKDFYTIPNMAKGFHLADVDLTAAYIEREGFTNPWILGLDLQFKLPGGLRLKASAEGTYLQYHVLYIRNQPKPGDPLYKETSEYEVTWARAALLGTITKDLLPLPIFRFYAGAGGGVHLVAPVVSDKFLINTLTDKFAELDPTTDVKIDPRFGFHLVLGLAIHPPALPLNIVVEGKYSFLPRGEYEEPHRFATVVLKMLF